MRFTVLSLLAHVAVVVPWRLSLEAPPIVGQVYIQAQLRPTPVATEKKPPANAGDKAKGNKNQQGKPGPRQLLTGKGGRPISTAPEAPAVPETAAAPVEAVITDQPVPPEYPAEARRRKLEACVLAAVSVGVGGEVERVEILASDVPGVFDQSVIESQQSAHYLPARRQGEAAASRVLAVAEFVLEPGRRLGCAARYAAQAEKLLAGSSQP
ncbi:MAG TPA: TonB family protein [Rhodocyclaceae bacterium]